MKLKGIYFLGLGLEALGVAAIVYGVVADIPALLVTGIIGVVIGAILVVTGVVQTARERRDGGAPQRPQA